MEGFGITHSHFTRSSAAVGARAAPRQPTVTESPTLTVGAAHGSGSTLIAGPLQAQQHPLQTNPTGLPARDESASSPAPRAAQHGPDDRRLTRTSASTAMLSPSQLDFVNKVEAKIKLERDVDSRWRRLSART